MPAPILIALSTMEEEIVQPPDRTLLRNRVRSALLHLPARLRKVVELKYDEGFTNKQIGGNMEISGERVRQLLRQAYRRLEVVLREDC